jgi:tetratricopeptide (TPR) repeat protein
LDAVTYPDEKVANFIRTNVVPLKLSFDAKPMADNYIVKWTPTLITVNGGGREHHRTVGFLPPEELIPSVLLGIGKVYFDQERINDASKYFEIIIKEYPKSDSTAEALYLKGVSEYKNTHDARPLKLAYELLQAGYPSSVWTKRAYPYRLL